MLTTVEVGAEEAGLEVWAADVAGGISPSRSVTPLLENAGGEEAERQLSRLMGQTAPTSLQTLRLSAPRLLADSHDGEIWVLNADDGGSVEYTLGGRHLDDSWKPLYFIATGLPVRTSATFEDARARVLSAILHDETGSVEVSAMPALARRGTLRLETWGGREIDAPWDDFWVFMVDDAPLANWAHPCRYVFVASDLSAVAVRYALTPLSARADSLRGMGDDNKLQVVIPFARKAFDPGIKKKRESPARLTGISYAGNVSNCYAVIVSGGYSTGNNHIRYWGDAAFIYSTLTLKYGYPKTNIYALISDGLDPAIDRSDDTDSPKDLDGDGFPDTCAPATLANITNVFIALQSKLQSNDQLFVFFTDHGSPGESGERSVELNLWNAGVLRDSDLKALTESIRCPVFFAMEQCYSGGFIDDLNQTNRAVATAARYDESSYAGDTYPYFDQWAYHWTAAMRGFYPQANAPWIDTDSCDADANEDGYVSFDEAYAYAMAHKYADDHPMRSENPTGLGKRLFFPMPTSGMLGVGELVMDPIPRLLVTNIPFALRISAQNVYGDIITNYTGPAVLWMEGGTEVELEPSNLVGFVDGVWTGLVTALNTATGVYLWVSDTVHAWRGHSDEVSIMDECRTNYVDAAGVHPMAPYTSWANAATTIQDAVNVAQDGGMVLVADGTYGTGGVPAPGCELTNRVCVTNAITVRSVNGAKYTIIRGSGGTLGAGAVRGVYLAGGAGLTGFTITNGRTLTTSGADREGGGVFLASSGGTVNDCVLSGNQAASGGGAVYANGNGTLNNCLLIGNSCDDDGGAAYLNSGGTMNNCTVGGNAAVNRGGGVVFAEGTLNNSVVWSNTAGDGNNIYLVSGGTVRYSCAADGVTHGSNGNITNDPSFFEVSPDNCRLKAGSPCVDAGSNAYAPTNVSPFDLLGNARIVHDVVDMGALEWQGPSCRVLGTNGAAIASGEPTSSAKGTDFGLSCPGVAVAHTLAIGNSGDGVLTISAITTNGSGAASFGGVDLPASVEPFSVSNFTVTFIPATTGALAAAMVILNNSATSNYTVNVAGLSRAEYASSTNIGPYAGGNEMTVTLGFPATVTNVLVGTNRWPVAVSASGTNWFSIMLPGVGMTGKVDFIMQSLEYGDLRLKDIYTYNPMGAIGGYVPDRWVESVSLPAGRWQQATVTYSNAIYAIGGYNDNWDMCDTVYRFNGTNWTETVAIPMAGAGWAAAIWEDAIYVAGASMTNVFRYDGSSWTEIAGLSTSPFLPLVTVFSNRLYVVSGYEVTNCLVYDGGRWVETAGLPDGISMSGAAGGVLGPYLFVAGGNLNGAATNQYRFDGTAWTSVGGLPQARESMGTAVWRDRIYAIGGYNWGQIIVTNVFSFDGAAWSESAGLPYGILDSGAAVLNDWLYSVGGNCYGGAISNVYRFAFAYPFYGVAPSNAPAAGGYEVILTGRHLGNGADITNVTLCGVAAPTISSQSDTQVIVVAGSGELGCGDVRVYSTSFGETIKSNAFTYSYSFILTIRSAHGAGTPPAGAYINPYGATLTNHMTGLETVGTTQYACKGWTMTGHDPMEGTSPQVVLTVTNNALLTWLWTTNFYLTASAGPNGDIDRGGGWLTNGETAVIAALPHPYYRFTNWTGSVETPDNPLNLVMDAAKWVTANFVANRTTNSPTPEWWLARYGITNNLEEAVTHDADGDGVPTGDEWTMNTDPTNGLSFLRVIGLGLEGDSGTLTWPCATDRVYDVQYVPSDLSDWTAVEGLTNLTPDTEWLVITNALDGSAQKFYRLKVRMP